MLRLLLIGTPLACLGLAPSALTQTPNQAFRYPGGWGNAALMTQVGEQAIVASSHVGSGLAGLHFLDRDAQGIWSSGQYIASPPIGSFPTGVAAVPGRIAASGDVGALGPRFVTLYEAQSGSDPVHWVPMDEVSEIGDTNESYGHSLALSPDAQWLFVGAPKTSAQGVFHAGRVFVYRQAAGSYDLFQLLEAETPEAGAFFGEAAVVTADRALIFELETEKARGFYFDGTAWSETQVLSGMGVDADSRPVQPG